MLANKYPCVLFVSIYPHGVAWNEGARTRTNARACGSYVHLCAPLAAIEIMQSGGARERERERGERMGSALETGEKKKRKKKEGEKKERREGNRGRNGETVGERARFRADKLVQKKKKLCGNNPIQEIL